MPTKAELETRIAELEAAHQRAETVADISAKMSLADNEHELLKQVIRIAQPYDVETAVIQYIHTDENDNPKISETIAMIDGSGQPIPKEILPETQYPIDEFPIYGLLFSSPDDPLFIEDAKTDPRCDPRLRSFFEASNVGASIALPITSGDQWYGMIAVSWSEPQTFNEELRKSVRALHSKIADVVIGRRAYLAAEAARHQNEQLFKISRRLNQARNEENLLGAIVPFAKQTGAHLLNLYYVDLENGKPGWAEIVAAWQEEGEPGTPVGTRLYLPEFEFSKLWFASPDKPLYITDVATDDRIDPNTKAFYDNLGLHGTIVIPLRQAKQWVGIISISWTEAHIFDELETTIFDALPALISPAIANRRLMTNLEKRVEERTEAMRESQARYQELFDTYREGVAFTDLEGNILECNQTYLDLLGYEDIEELQSKTFIDLTPPEYHEMEAQIVNERVMVHGYSGEYEKEYIRKDGTRVPIITRAWLRYDDEGEPIGLWGSVRDISEQKESTALINRLKSLIDSTNDFVSTSDLEGNVLYVNPMGLQMVGLGEFEPGTVQIADFHSPEWVQKIDKEILPIVEKQGVWSGELELQTTGGDAIPVSGVIMLIRDDADEPIGFGAIYRDISEQKEAEDAIRESQQLFQTFLDNFPAIVFAKDPEGHVILSNQVLNETYGMTREEMLGKTIYDLMPGNEELASKVWAGEKHVLETQQPAEEEQVVMESDGEHIKLSTIFPLINDEGESYAVGVIAMDITERRRAEVERARLQQQIIEAQQQTLRELASPIIPIVEGIIVLPLIGSIDTSRAREITRTLLAGISDHRAKAVIIDITGVPVVDSGVADHLNKTIQAARLKGTRTIITGISDAVAETIVDLGIDWSNIETLRNLQAGLLSALNKLDIQLNE